MENLQRLRVLRAVAQHGSFTAAGAVLAMSQPAVSQHVGALERELGSRLVDRSPVGARLTPEGEIVLGHALRILKSCDDTRRDLDEIRSGDRATVRIAAFPTACTQLLPPATAQWCRRHPGAPFTFTECDADRTVELARQGAVDLALTYDYAAHPIDLRGLRVVPLADDPLLLAVPAGHPLAGRPVVDVGALADEEWISGTSFACTESLRAICGVAGFTPRIRLDSSRYPTTLALVAVGHGIALVPVTALAHPPAGVVIRPLRPAPPPRRLWTVTPPDPPPAVTDLIDCLLAGGATTGRSTYATPRS